MNQFSLHIPPQAFGVLPKTKRIKSIISRKTNKLTQYTYQEDNATHLEQFDNVFLCAYFSFFPDAETMVSRMRNLRSIEIRWRVEAWKPCGAFLSTNAGYKVTTWSMPTSSREVSWTEWCFMYVLSDEGWGTRACKDLESYIGCSVHLLSIKNPKDPL